MVSRAWKVKGIDLDGTMLENARRVVAVRVAELYAHAPSVGQPQQAEALHDLRISAKRLRYTLELFEPWLGNAAHRQIERIKAVQDSLGDIHDHDVRIKVIGDELSRLMFEQSLHTREAIAEASAAALAAVEAASLRPPPDDPRRGLIALLGREHQARRKAYVRFREIWEQYAAEGMRQELVMLSAMPLPPGEGCRA